MAWHMQVPLSSSDLRKPVESKPVVNLLGRHRAELEN